jgi:hypothetical protein
MFAPIARLLRQQRQQAAAAAHLEVDHSGLTQEQIGKLAIVLQIMCCRLCTCHVKSALGIPVRTTAALFCRGFDCVCLSSQPLAWKCCSCFT